MRERYSIGDLARRTGLPVRTIRFYSDSGLLPPTDRSPANHRRYDLAAVARLDLVRTLRELGLDLATIRRVLADELTVAQAAARHADALDVQIRVLRTRAAVLRAIASRAEPPNEPNPEELTLMHRVVRLSEDERHRLITDFVDRAFGGLDVNEDFVAWLRSALPYLPDEPTTAQVDAWIELSELVRDEDFVASVRRMAEHQAAEIAEGGRMGLHHELTIKVRDRVTAAIDAGVEPDSPAAAEILSDVVARYAETFGTEDTPAYRAKLVTRLRTADDPRVERYVRLIGIINDWPETPPLGPVFGWLIAALDPK
ncbi:MerR family transcriptional regulator [Asanoa iriomotensis]|uniref:MerR family transcriptional regulator n=1 Tax=Asanoa iriomotensis TaxID=234613 RepID=A0ABQ4BV57_9ACTN|nr:MerR family transcriptional regulator [Asanoa iriomotensis]GIF54412.1 MerR family transcriptional regulator [Asanoa iriomotensis]